MQCVESLRVQAYFDGEIDAVSAAEIERHTEHCAECRALLHDLGQMRTAIRRDIPNDHAPPALRDRIVRALDEESAAPSKRAGRWSPAFWIGAISGAGTAAIAAILAFILLSPTLAKPLVEELVNAHVRSLTSSRLIEVVSTDRHTVKPWFASHAEVSPVVADFEPQGYRLIGGRSDYFEHQRAAVVVYRHGLHTINVFSWAPTHRFLPSDTTHHGYHLAFWRAGDLEYCAVSDTGWEELRGLTRLLQDLSAREE